MTVDIIGIVHLDLRNYPSVKAKREMNEIYFYCNRSKKELRDSAILGLVRCSSAGPVSSVDWEPSSLSALYYRLEKLYGGAYLVVSQTADDA